MSDINRVVLTGHLGNDPEMKYFESGSVVVNFSVAIDEWQGQEKGSKTIWIDCRAWGKKAEFVGDYAKKGSLVMVDGRLSVENWTSQDGTKRSKVLVLVNDLKIVDKK
jgi:single-strand DNA-binding protein